RPYLPGPTPRGARGRLGRGHPSLGRVGTMFVRSVVADAFGTNCYVVAPAEGEECLVVDPGIGVEGRVQEILREHRLRPAAVLLTHGHLDHVYAVTPVCAGTVAAHIHTDDRYRLVDPLASLGPGLLPALEQQFGRRA